MGIWIVDILIDIHKTLIVDLWYIYYIETSANVQVRTHIALLVALDSACPKLWSGFNYLKRLTMYVILQISSMVRTVALFRSIAWPKDHTNKNTKNHLLWGTSWAQTFCCIRQTISFRFLKLYFYCYNQFICDENDF